MPFPPAAEKAEARKTSDLVASVKGLAEVRCRNGRVTAGNGASVKGLAKVPAGHLRIHAARSAHHVTARHSPLTIAIRHSLPWSQPTAVGSMFVFTPPTVDPAAECHPCEEDGRYNTARLVRLAAVAAAAVATVVAAVARASRA